MARATTGSGVDAVVKIEMPPYPSFATEVRTLLAADGHSYVCSIEHDVGRHANLQERLGPSLRVFDLPVPSQLEILCSTLQRAWTTPAPQGLPTGVDARAIWE